jgi:hypothetical protein
VQHTTVVGSLVGVWGPLHGGIGQPPWWGLRCDTDQRGQPPWGGAWCGVCLSASVAEGATALNIAAISLYRGSVPDSKCCVVVLAVGSRRW